MNRNNEQDVRRFGQCIASLEKYFDKLLSEEMKRVYLTGLEDLPIETIEYLTALAIQRCKWFPKIAELRELAGEAPEDDATRAWQLFLKATGQGYWSSVYFADPCIVAAIRYTFGGWVQACSQLRELSEEMRRSRQKEFMTNYRLARRLPSRQSEHYLEGHCEQNNRGTYGKHRRGALPKTQPVIVANEAGYADVTVVQIQVDPETGAIAEAARRLLADPYRIESLKQLQSNGRQALLLEASIPEPASEESRLMTPEEIQRAIQDFKAGVRMTPPPAKARPSLDSHEAGVELVAEVSE